MISKRLVVCGLVLGLSAPAAHALPWIELSSDQMLPTHVEPGDLFESTIRVHADGTVPEMLRVTVTDPLGEVLDVFETESITFDLNYELDPGAPWGVYHYRATYFGEGLSADSISREGAFLVAAGGLCAFKFIDDDGNGVFNEDGEDLAEGWEICITGPEDLGCELTDEDGVVCHFFTDPGTYEVCETQMDGWEVTTPGGECVDVDMVDGDVAKVLFGNRMIDVPTRTTTWSKVKSSYR
jgi:hypothetical protein